MSKKRYRAGSGNVFNDLGGPNPRVHAVKAQLIFEIATLLKERDLKQMEAGELFGVQQPIASRMLRGDFRQFSVERLLRFLVEVDQDVEIVVTPHRDPKNAAALRVF